MQGLTRNPLADPGILGINAGAAFAMVLAISVFGVSDLAGLRLVRASPALRCAMVLVHAIAAVGRDGATPVKVAIAGAALTAALRQLDPGRAAHRPPDHRGVPAVVRSARSAAATSTCC